MATFSSRATWRGRIGLCGARSRRMTGCQCHAWRFRPGSSCRGRADAWIRESEIEDTALPLYEGRMIGQFDFSEKGWVSGKGRVLFGKLSHGSGSRLIRSI